uniref:beta-galactosidase n=1 Tax=Eubacterium cellulosolvens TaxID=29322 RepID=UPI00138AB6A9|nr:beta-galactosidase trimerization domain-containing protein [[Eubacterium] cellulosolvens]
MIKELIYGLAWKPEGLPYEKLEKSIHQLHDAGINTVFLEMGTAASDVLKCCGENSMQVVIDVSGADAGDPDFRQFLETAGVSDCVIGFQVCDDAELMKCAESVRRRGQEFVELLSTRAAVQDQMTGAETAFCGDSARGGYDYTEGDGVENPGDENVSRNPGVKKPFRVAEIEIPEDWRTMPYPGQLKLQILSVFAYGARGVVLRESRTSSSMGSVCRGNLRELVFSGELYDEIAEAGAALQKIGSSLKNYKANCRAAVIADQQLFKMFPAEASAECADTPGYREILHEYYDLLYRMNVECDVTDEAAIGDADLKESYDLIVTPSLYSASEKLIRNLKRFVKSGGVLISTVMSFRANEKAKVHDGPLPHGMTAVFGASYEKVVGASNVTVAGRRITHFAELLNADEVDRVYSYTHHYWGKYAAITSHGYGKGTAWYIGCFPERDILERIVKRAAEAAGIRLPAAHWPMAYRSGMISPKTEMTFGFNYTSENRCISCPYDQVEDLLTGKKYRRGNPIDLKDWGVMVLKHRI